MPGEGGAGATMHHRHIHDNAPTCTSHDKRPEAYDDNNENNINKDNNDGYDVAVSHKP
jgi:hypothetical protein